MPQKPICHSEQFGAFLAFWQSEILWRGETESLLNVQSCKLCNNKYIIVSTQITNIEIFAFTVVLVFKLLSRKVLFINGKTIETVKK